MAKRSKIRNINNDDPRRIAVIQACIFAFRSTCQLYQWTDYDAGEFIANGCIVLFQHNDVYYGISNAHVLADLHLHTTFFVLQDKSTITVGGELFYSDPLFSDRRQDDYLDMAIVKLNDNVTGFLKANGHVFLCLDQLISGLRLRQGNVVLLAGYPASKTMIDHKRRAIRVEPLMATTIPYLRNFKLAHFKQGFHHLIEFPIRSFKEVSSGQRMRAANLEGISGSGLWLLIGEDGRPLPDPRLIGIVSEYHENSAVIIATKIDLYVNVIRQRFDPTLPNNGVSIDLDWVDKP